MSVGVIVALSPPREAEIAAAIGAHPALSVARRCADLAEALAAVEAGVGTVLATSEHPRLDRNTVRRLAKSGVEVVGLPTNDETRDAMLAFGVETVLSPGISAVDAAEAIHAVATEQPEPDVPIPDVALDDAPAGAIVAVWGPAGAPGRTTLACNIAAEAGRAGTDTVLVDADTYGGGAASALGVLDEAPGIAALARVASRGELTDAVFSRHAAEVAPGLRLVSGISRADRWREIPPASLDAIWDAARRAAPLVVVDTGFSLEDADALGGLERNAATLSALATADVVVAVGSSEPLAIQRLVQGLGDLTPLLSDVSTRVVVVNRIRASVAGSSPERAVADALARYASIARTWTVPYDAKACDAATLGGAVLAECAPRSSARRAIAALAEHVVSATRAAIPADVSAR